MTTRRTLPQMVMALHARHPEEAFLAGCLALPYETDDEAFPPIRKPHRNCGCPDCEAGHRQAMQERAALVREHIRAGRQHRLV